MKRSLLISLSIAVCAFFLSPVGCTDDSTVPNPTDDTVTPTDTPTDPPVDTPTDPPVDTPADPPVDTPTDPVDDPEGDDICDPNSSDECNDPDNPPEEQPVPIEEPECETDDCSEDGSILIQCVDGKIQTENCEFGCAEGKCNAPECTETVCADDKTLNVCNEGHIVANICADKCENNTCVAAPECTQTQCNGNILEVCTSGTLTKQTCEYGCKDAKCVVPECTKTACKDSSTLNECNDGKINAKKCDYGCSDAKCWPNPIISLNGKRVLFIGNSLTHYGQTVLLNKRCIGKGEGRFKEVASYYGDNVIVTSFTWGSAGFKDGRDVKNADDDCYSDDEAKDCGNKGTKNKKCMTLWTENHSDAKTYGNYDLLRTLHPCCYNENKDSDGNSICKKCTTKDEIYNQDYVIIQERTGSYESTEKYAKKIKALFPPDTDSHKTLFVIHLPHVVYDGTEHNDGKRYTGGGTGNKTLLAANNLHKEGWLVVPWGNFIFKAYKNTYSDVTDVFGQSFKHEDFVVTKHSSGTSDYKHQNYMSGYLEALAIYSTITGHTAIASDYSIKKNWTDSTKDADRKYTINGKIDVPAVKAAIAKGYYEKVADTNYGYILLSADTMKALQNRLNQEIRVYDNQIIHMEPMTAAGSFFPDTLKMTNVANMTDGKKSYDKDNKTTYSGFTWASSADVAKNFKSAPHYDANGTQNASGKYLCGFTYKLPKQVVVNRMRFYNPATTLEINGFDVLLSKDNKNWTVAYSGKDLVKNLKYTKYTNSSNANYISATFYPTEAQYVRFALTEPRYQPDSTMSDADIKKLIADYNSKYGQSVDKINTNPQSFRIVEFELFKYTEHW